MTQHTLTLGGRRTRTRTRTRRRGRGRNGGTFVADVATPLALLGATQYMKSKFSRRSSKRRKSRKNYSLRRRRRY